MKERAVVFGKAVRLVGIVTDPADGGPYGDRPACILLNAGLVHRVGPNRLHVRLARALASAGFLVMRFDLSGRGDSDVRGDGLSFLESSLAETREAMDYLASARETRKFVLMGICSGAGNAFHAATADSRVVGAVLIDGYAYPTRQYYVHYYARRLRNASSWWNTLTARNALGRKLWGNLGSRPDEDGEDFGNPFGDLTPPSRDTAAAALRRVIAQRTNLFFIFSGSTGTYKYQNQLRDAFPDVPFNGRVEVAYFPNADHTFTRLYNQERLINVIKRWTFAVDAATTQSSDAQEGTDVASESLRVRRPTLPSDYKPVHQELSLAQPTLIRLSIENLLTATDRRRRYQWYYRDNPAGSGDVFLLGCANGSETDVEFVGCTGIAPRIFMHNGRRLRAALSADFAVDQSHRTVLPALKLQRAAHDFAKAHCDISYGFPNTRAVGVFLRLGYRVFGKMSRYVKVLRHEPYLRRLRRFPWAAPAAARFLDAAVQTREQMRGRLGPSWLRLQWLSDFDERFDVLWEQTRHQYGIIGQRNAEWLRWRFSASSGSQCAIAALVDARTMELRAYAVVAQKEAEIARIGDFAALSPRELGVLLDRLAPELRLQGYTSAAIHFLGPAWVGELLQAHHFLLRGDDRPMVIDIGTELDPHVVLSQENWYLTSADTDT